MFQALIKRIEKIPNQLEDVAFASLKANEGVVLDYITDVQLFEKGIDGKGNSLGEYAPATITQKQIKGQKISNITLRDTGDYYSSHKLSIDGVVSADTSKPDQDLAIEFGIDILKITDEGMDSFIEDFILDDVIKFTRKEIC